MMQIILHAIIDQEEEEDAEKGEEIPLRWIDMEDEEEGEEEEDNGGYPLKEDFFSAAKFLHFPNRCVLEPKTAGYAPFARLTTLWGMLGTHAACATIA